MAKAKKKKWIKFRHKVITKILYWFIKPIAVLKYHIKIENFREKNKRQYLILSNHQTAFDQFFIGMSFYEPLYYISSEDLFSKGWVSKLITYLVAPIPFKKSASDVRAVKNCYNVVKEGGSIVLFPEGNRTYSGKTEYMKDSIVGLVRILKLPVVFYRIEGGYGVQPRWSDVTRKGKMRGYVSHILEPDEYMKMSDEELFSYIKEQLYVDETQLGGLYYHKRNAEYLERVMYICPDCGLSEFISKGDSITCNKCEKSIRYLPSKELKGIGFEFPFKYVNDWYDYQNDFIRNLELTPYQDSLIYTDVVSFSEVIPYKKKNLLDKEAEFSIYADRFKVKIKKEESIFRFVDISAATVLGKNKLNLYVGDKIYQVKGKIPKYLLSCRKHKKRRYKWRIFGTIVYGEA